MSTATAAAIDVRRSDERFSTDLGWLDARHSFSFGQHRDPRNLGHGLLIVSNDDWIAPGAGFDPHQHADMEIVTWVLEGALDHRDSAGNEGSIVPGLAQRMSAGRGITHSEANHSDTERVHVVQMWVAPDERCIEPDYEQVDVNDRLDAGGLVPVASGRGHDGAIVIRQGDAVMWVGRLTDGETVEVPVAPFVHLYVARGSVVLDGTRLGEGDAARLTDAGGLGLRSTGDSEVIIWETHREAIR